MNIIIFQRIDIFITYYNMDLELEFKAPPTLEERVSKLEEFAKDPPQFGNLLSKIEKIENDFYKQTDQANYAAMQKFIKI